MFDAHYSGFFPPLIMKRAVLHLGTSTALPKVVID